MRAVVNPISLACCIAAIALFVSGLDYRIAREQGLERKTVCSCKPEIKGRQLYASLCQSSSIKGPVEQECLYR